VYIFLCEVCCMSLVSAVYIFFTVHFLYRVYIFFGSFSSLFALVKSWLSMEPRLYTCVHDSACVYDSTGMGSSYKSRTTSLMCTHMPAYLQVLVT